MSEDLRKREIEIMARNFVIMMKNDPNYERPDRKFGRPKG